MKKYGIFLLFTIFAAVIFFSCSQEESNPMNSPLELQSPYDVQWKLEGFVTVDGQGKQSLKVALYQNKSDAYLLTLRKDSTFVGTSSANNISGKYAYNTSRGTISFSLPIKYDNKIAENSDGDLYMDCLSKVSRYRVFIDQLHLYYSNTQYLIYRPTPTGSTAR